jgi:hypothetical protein
MTRAETLYHRCRAVQNNLAVSGDSAKRLFFSLHSAARAATRRHWRDRVRGDSWTVQIGESLGLQAA